jgi:phage terminase small subunit
MPILSNPRHERFAQACARGVNASKAYVDAGYRRTGARQNGFRLSSRPDIAARVRELQTIGAEEAIAAEISKRNVRLQGLQDTINRLEAIIDVRSKSMTDVPGAQRDC